MSNLNLSDDSKEETDSLSGCTSTNGAGEKTGTSTIPLMTTEEVEKSWKDGWKEEKKGGKRREK
jgi:hypothetical protein